MSKKLTRELIVQKVRSDKLAQIKNLNLWGNNIDNVDILTQMPSLEIVSLSVNKISTLKPFAELPKLRELYLRNNMISDLNEIKYLIGCENLSILWLSENPICKNKNYRYVVVGILPQLEKLDDVAITEEERAKAEQKLNGTYQSDEEEDGSPEKNEEENNLMKSQSQHNNTHKNNNKRHNYEEEYDAYDDDLTDKFQKQNEINRGPQKYQSSKMAYGEKKFNSPEDIYDDLYEKSNFEDDYRNISSSKKDRRNFQRFKSQRMPETRYDDYSNKYNFGMNENDRDEYEEYEDREYRKEPGYERLSNKKNVVKEQNFKRSEENQRGYNESRENRGNSNVLNSVLLLLNELNSEQLSIVKRECERIEQS